MDPNKYLEPEVELVPYLAGYSWLVEHSSLGWSNERFSYLKTNRVASSDNGYYPFRDGNENFFRTGITITWRHPDDGKLVFERFPNRPSLIERDPFGSNVQ